MTVHVRARTTSRAWLALTPEPERELPAALAVLRRATGGDDADATREAERAEAFVLRGSEPSYLAWLLEAAELAARTEGSSDPEVARAAEIVGEVVRNQAGLRLGLPGGGRRRAVSRRALEAVAGAP